MTPPGCSLPMPVLGSWGSLWDQLNKTQRNSFPPDNGTTGLVWLYCDFVRVFILSWMALMDLWCYATVLSGRRVIEEAKRLNQLVPSAKNMEGEGITMKKTLKVNSTVQQVFGFLTCTWGLFFPSGLQKVQISCCAASDLDRPPSGGRVVTGGWMARAFVEGYGSLEHRSQDASRRQHCCWTPHWTWPGSYQSACPVHVFPFSSDWSKDFCWAIPAKIRSSSFPSSVSSRYLLSSIPLCLLVI